MKIVRKFKKFNCYSRWFI